MLSPFEPSQPMCVPRYLYLPWSRWKHGDKQSREQRVEENTGKRDKGMGTGMSPGQHPTCGVVLRFWLTAAR